MLIGHPAWPPPALLGGAFYVDTGGREAVKWLGLRDAGVRLGSARQRRIYLAVLATFIIVGGLAIALAIAELA